MKLTAGAPRGAPLAGRAVALLLVAFWGGCAPSEDEQAWQEAERRQQPQAYQQFLVKHPTSARADDALARLAPFETSHAPIVAIAYAAYIRAQPDSPRAHELNSRLQQVEFDQAKGSGTLRAYKNYLARHPQAPQAPAARAAMNELLQAGRPESLKGVTSVRLSVTQTYAEAEGVTLPFVEMAGRLSEEYLGLRVAGDTGKAEAELAVSASCKAIGQSYSLYGIGFRGDTHYSGASVAGTLRLSKAGRTLFEERFEGKQAPPERVQKEQFLTPASAPFLPAFRLGYPTALVRLLARAGGLPFVEQALEDKEALVQLGAAAAIGVLRDPRRIKVAVTAMSNKAEPVQHELIRALASTRDPAAFEPLLAALKHKSPRIVVAAAQGLGALKDERAVDPLIGLLEMNRPDYGSAAAAALREITGRFYGPDAARWKEWRSQRSAGG